MKKPSLKFKDKRSVLVALICLSVLVILPLLVDYQLSKTDRYYTELLRVYECFSEICPVDFDSDGTLGRVFVDRTSTPTPHRYTLIAKENGKELIRLPYWQLDDTARTHVATTQEYASGKTHLLVYERTGREALEINAVYAWNGNEMMQIAPSDFEKELFKAMAARDQNGTFNDWVLYHMVRVPTLIGYYLILILAVIFLGRRLIRQ